MARAYKVEAPGAIRYASSTTHARELRTELMESLGCNKKDISIDEEVDIPTSKTDLIPWLNDQLAEFDGFEESEEEEEEES
jgi:hypothetical protein